MDELEAIQAKIDKLEEEKKRLQENQYKFLGNCMKQEFGKELGRMKKQDMKAFVHHLRELYDREQDSLLGQEVDADYERLREEGDL